MGLASVPLTTVSCASHHEGLKAGDSTETARCSGRSVANVVFADGISWKTNIHISSRSSQGLGQLGVDETFTGNIIYPEVYVCIYTNIFIYIYTHMKC